MTNFVLLQMSDEMPAQVRWKFRNFYSGFLHSTFAKQFLIGVDCLSHFRRFMRLRNRDEFNIVNRSPRFRRGLRNLLAHSLQIFSDRRHFVEASAAADTYY